RRVVLPHFHRLVSRVSRRGRMYPVQSQAGSEPASGRNSSGARAEKSTSPTSPTSRFGALTGVGIGCGGMTCLRHVGLATLLCTCVAHSLQVLCRFFAGSLQGGPPKCKQ